MAHDDYEVVVYKVLTYLYECIKSGVSPLAEKAREVAGVNDVYWDVVLKGLVEDGLASALVVHGWHGDEYRDLRITAKGAEFVKENSKMRAVAKFLGSAFNAVVEGAIAATMAMT